MCAIKLVYREVYAMLCNTEEINNYVATQSVTYMLQMFLLRICIPLWSWCSIIRDSISYQMLNSCGKIAIYNTVHNSSLQMTQLTRNTEIYIFLPFCILQNHYILRQQRRALFRQCYL